MWVGRPAGQRWCRAQPFHLVIILLTAGLWLLAYPAWRERRYLLAVNEQGRVWRRYLRGPEQ